MLNIEQYIKIFLLVIADLIILLVTPYLALYVRLDGNTASYHYQELNEHALVLMLLGLVCFGLFRLYKRLWRYASLDEVAAILGAVTLTSGVHALYVFIVGAKLPKSMYLMDWFFMLFFVGAVRFCVRVVHYFRKKRSVKHKSNILIIGAGDAGAMIAREIQQHYYSSKQLVGFIDDNKYKANKRMFGAVVLGNTNDIPMVVSEHQVDEMIIAMPSVSGEAVRKIISKCKETKCSLRILPGMYELIDGRVSVNQLRNVDLEDLLRRDAIILNLKEIAQYLSGKRVLITGAGGSIGSELCRQIAKMKPARMILLGKGENSIYEIHRELREKYPDIDMEPVIADVRDEKRIAAIFKKSFPQVVFHAAAHKHVPLMETQPVEAVKNNIFGTKVVAEAAVSSGAEIFVMISTDKAVNPTSVMGATKRVAELVVQRMNQKGTTKCMAVRFGNVLGSRGSVIPLFKEQIAKGGPITITHPDMKRYFMTIPEASQLVLQAGALARGGEVFVLDMGKPVKIVDMASDLIELSGLTPHKDIEIRFTGLRPGEKLFEELLTAEEGTLSTKHNKIYRAKLRTLSDGVLEKGLFILSNTQDRSEIIQILQELIPTYMSKPIQEPAAEHKQSGQADFLEVIQGEQEYNVSS